MKRQKSAPGSRKAAIRNSVARSPLLGKGGAHQRGRSAERQQDKQALRRRVRQSPHPEERAA